MNNSNETKIEWKSRLQNELEILDEREKRQKSLLKIEILTKILDLVKDI